IFVSIITFTIICSTILFINNYYLLIVITLLIGGFSFYIFPDKRKRFNHSRFNTKKSRMNLTDEVLSQSKDAIITTDFDLKITL
ncbi:hypothetical protein ACE400_29810, partial [Salmonella enterica]|uniref:hypothetical protein n=1 Tax=Salmonella enterica TaxID=28901 RepID=UPI003D2AB0C1